MKVSDYVSDMILNTTFVIDVEEVSCSYPYDFKYVSYSFKIPFGYCKYLNYLSDLFVLLMVI